MKRYTGVLSDYFREQVSQVDAFTLLNEYVIYFEAFTNTLMEIDSNFSIVEDMINEVHEHLFPQYP
jgi:radical SAM superfamily enzyme